MKFLTGKVVWSEVEDIYCQEINIATVIGCLQGFCNAKNDKLYLDVVHKTDLIF